MISLIVFDSRMKVIIAVLGFFFVFVPLFKNVGRRRKSTYLPGGLSPTPDPNEVKLADPYATPKSAEPEKTQAPWGSPADKADFRSASEKSSFKQYAPGSALIPDEKMKDDTDYLWE